MGNISIHKNDPTNIMKNPHHVEFRPQKTNNSGNEIETMVYLAMEYSGDIATGTDGHPLLLACWLQGS